MKDTIAHYLVLGGTGGIGYGFAKELLAHNEQVTLLVRSKKKAQQLFREQPNLQLVEGDAMDLPLLQQLGVKATHIFHGINYPYHRWQGNMEQVTANVIAAAAHNKATILFPGNVYNYGLRTKPITETDEPNPHTRKGAIRVKLEAMLQQAAVEGTCNVLILRLPDFWGPNVLNPVMEPLFNVAKKAKTIWLVNADIPHQLVYTPDAARALYQLLQTPLPENFTIYHFGGEVVPSIKQWFGQVAKEAGTAPGYTLYSKWFVSVMGLFLPMLHELKEMLYLYENTIVLDDSKLKNALPAFTPTPMQEAIRETLLWYRNGERSSPEIRPQDAPADAPADKARATGLSIS